MTPPAEMMFKALADATRQRLLRVLSAHELSVSELVQVLEQPQSTISRHLKVLRDAELVVDRRAGATTLYAVAPVAGGRANGHGLRDQLLEWIGNERLDAGTQARLEQVLAVRRGGSFFETIGSRWDQLRVDAFGDAFHLEALTALLPRDWTVADIGTGTGYLLPVLAERFAKVIAVDPAANMLELARRRPELREATNVEFRAGSLEQLPLGDGELDLAIASLVLHHVAEPAAALREAGRCVRTGGRLLLVEQAAHEHQVFHDRMGDVWWGFEPEAVEACVAEAGFGQVRVSGLRSARTSGRSVGEVPRLFVLTAEKQSSDGSMSSDE